MRRIIARRLFLLVLGAAAGVPCLIASAAAQSAPPTWSAPSTIDRIALNGVAVTAGQTHAGIDATLQLGGQITGHVQDAGGHPLQNICAVANDASLPDPFSQPPAGSTATDANGDYAITVPAGNYKVTFFDRCGGSGNYLQQWYQDKPDFASADPVAVTAGQTHAGIDATMAPVTPPSPVSIAAPAISGTAREGQLLTESHGLWSNSPVGYGYQWQRCDSGGGSCSAIGGATGQTYTLVAADVGHTIRVLETANNAGGSSAPASSGATPVVVAAPPPAPAGSVSSASGSSTTPGGTASASNAGTSVNAVGEGALTLSQYGSNPAGQPTFSTAGRFFDVRVASGSSFSSLTITDCNLNGGKSLQWWNGSAWAAVSPQSYTPGPPACVTATLGTGSSPTIAQLTGTVFAVALAARPKPAIAKLGNAKVTGATVMVPVSCTGRSRASCTATLTLTVTETVKGGKIIAITAANKKPSKPHKKVMVLGKTSVRLSVGQRKTVKITLNAAGKRLLAARHTLKVKLALTQPGSTATSSRVTFKLPANKHKNKPQNH